MREGRVRTTAVDKIDSMSVVTGRKLTLWIAPGATFTTSRLRLHYISAGLTASTNVWGNVRFGISMCATRR